MKLSYKPIALLFTVISIAAVSCKKDRQTQSSTDTFPKAFQYQGVTLSAERVFTYQGEVSDPVVKAKAIISTGLNLMSHSVSTPQNDITFTSPEKIEIANDHYSGHLSSNGKQTFYNDVHTEISMDNGDDIRAVFSPFYKHLNIFNENNKYLYTSSLIFTSDNSAAKVIGIDICFLHRDPTTNKLIKKYTTSSSNEFNPPSINTALGKNDTLAIREFTTNYIIKK